MLKRMVSGILKHAKHTRAHTHKKKRGCKFQAKMATEENPDAGSIPETVSNRMIKRMVTGILKHAKHTHARTRTQKNVVARVAAAAATATTTIACL